MDPAQASPLRKRYTAEHVNPFSKEIYGKEFMRMHGAVGNNTFDVRGDRYDGDTVLRLSDKRKAEGGDTLSAKLGR